jgi:hypothetical protein
MSKQSTASVHADIDGGWLVAAVLCNQPRTCFLRSLLGGPLFGRLFSRSLSPAWKHCLPVRSNGRTGCRYPRLSQLEVDRGQTVSLPLPFAPLCSSPVRQRHKTRTEGIREFISCHQRYRPMLGGQGSGPCLLFRRQACLFCRRRIVLILRHQMTLDQHRHFLEQCHVLQIIGRRNQPRQHGLARGLRQHSRRHA